MSDNIVAIGFLVVYVSAMCVGLYMKDKKILKQEVIIENQNKTIERLTARMLVTNYEEVLLEEANRKYTLRNKGKEDGNR